MKMLQEFKDFAMKGNVVDMAVGVIIGAAFGKIVTSLVTDVVMPPLGVFIGGMNFTDLSLTVKQASAGAPAVVIAYGKFIQTVVDFTIIAWVIFLAIKGINMLKRQKEEAPAPETPPAPTPTESLLGEIRDLLKDK